MILKSCVLTVRIGKKQWKYNEKNKTKKQWKEKKNTMKYNEMKYNENTMKWNTMKWNTMKKQIGGKTYMELFELIVRYYFIVRSNNIKWILKRLIDRDHWNSKFMSRIFLSIADMGHCLAVQLLTITACWLLPCIANMFLHKLYN